MPTGAVTVAADGSLSVATASGSAIAGRVGVFDFGAGPGSATGMTAEGVNRLLGPAGAKPQAGMAVVDQGAIEGSNEDAVHGSMQLILVQRQAEMMQKAVSVFSNDFDKTAGEELGRV